MEKTMWWNYRFAFKCEDFGDPEIHRVWGIYENIVIPIVKEMFPNDIENWRIHHRWNNDHAGHRYSFIFRCPKNTTRHIISYINSHPVITKYKEWGWIDECYLEEEFNHPPKRLEKLSAHTDQAWTEAMQESWTPFIQGACDMQMLFFLERKPKKFNNKSSDVLWATEKLYEKYLYKIEKEMKKVWEEECGHALLHHLSCIWNFNKIKVKVIL